MHIYWTTHTNVFIESNYSFEIVDQSWELLVMLVFICIMSSDLLGFN